MKNQKQLTLLPKLMELFSASYRKDISYGDYRFSGVEYDYESYRACSNGSDCCNDDYCRCGIIQNATITSVDINELIIGLLENSDEIINSYCVDRLIRQSDLKETSNWELNISNGYYGEETHGCSPDQEILNQLIEEFKSLISLNDADKIKFCLQSEYGHVLPSLEKCESLKIISVPLEKIELFNDNYIRKISKKYVNQYNNYKLPRAVCQPAGDKYRVIDGYHRMTSAVNLGLKEVEILVME